MPGSPPTCCPWKTTNTCPGSQFPGSTVPVDVEGPVAVTRAVCPLDPCRPPARENISVRRSM